MLSKVPVKLLTTTIEGKYAQLNYFKHNDDLFIVITEKDDSNYVSSEIKLITFDDENDIESYMGKVAMNKQDNSLGEYLENPVSYIEYITKHEYFIRDNYLLVVNSSTMDVETPSVDLIMLELENKRAVVGYIAELIVKQIVDYYLDEERIKDYWHEILDDALISNKGDGDFYFMDTISELQILDTDNLLLKQLYANLINILDLYKKNVESGNVEKMLKDNVAYEITDELFLKCSNGEFKVEKV